MTDPESSGEHVALSEFETTFSTDEAHIRDAEWGEMRVGVETYHEEFDDAPLLEGLPNDRCQCPHWGYLQTGRMTVRYADHEEVVEADEVYYMAPDHTIVVDAGTELVEFSPKEEFQKTATVAQRNLAELEKGRDDTT